MRATETAYDGAPRPGQPLDGLRVLALEQMQALPFATQLLARLGADVVKIEHPEHGDIGRGSQPAMAEPDGEPAGITYLRNNFNKRSVTIDLKTAAGRQLVLDLAPRFDIVGENFRAGALADLGLGYHDVAAVHPAVVYLSISGFGNTSDTPYRTWPAYAGMAEAMSGLYEWKRPPGQPPVVNPLGALGDIGTALFGVVGVLAALRQRDTTGVGQYVDLAMFDSMISFADVVPSYWSMGVEPDPDHGVPMILDGFESGSGWFVVQVGREHEFARLAAVLGTPEWVDDPRFATRAGWRRHIDVIREAVRRWARDMTNLEASHALAAAGVAAAPVMDAQQVVDDPHVAARNMLVELSRSDGVPDPVLSPGNPVKMSAVPEVPDRRPPWLGEHTTDVLAGELGLSASDLHQLRSDGIIR